MTLVREIQLLLERTYGKTGVNLEEFILTPHRGHTLAAMAGASAAQISDLGRVFLRIVDGKLRMGIYYDSRVIATLEQNNPQHGLNDENVLPFMVFLEELDHAIHVALKFREGNRNIYSEEFVRDLELQAKVDTYLVLQIFCAFFNANKKLTHADRRWLKSCVFDSENFAYEEPLIAERYHETNRYGRRYVKFLETLTPARRTTEIRRFRKLAYRAKQDRIAALAA
jgi:hypothetical protein